MQPASLPSFRPNFDRILTEHYPMQRGGDVGRCKIDQNITINASKMTVKSGKFRRRMLIAEWSSIVSQSMVSPIPLNPKPKSNSSQVLLDYSEQFVEERDVYIWRRLNLVWLLNHWCCLLDWLNRLRRLWWLSIHRLRRLCWLV